MPRFAVIVPSFQQAKFLDRTLESILAQEVEGLEVFVADGGSSDGTLEILQRFDDRVRWVSEPDRGQAHAVNKGIAATTAPLIGWLNSDDVYYPGALRTALTAFESQPEADVAYGNAVHIDEHDEVIEPYPTEEFDAARLLEVCFLCQPATFFRRTVVERFGGLDESLHYSMDYEYWIRLSQAGARFEKVDELLAGSRMYPDNKTLGARVPVHAEINDMLRRVLGRVPERWIFNYAHAVIEGRGVSREAGWEFIWPLAAETLRAARRWHEPWNARIWGTVAEWLSGQISRSVHGVVSR